MEQENKNVVGKGPDVFTIVLTSVGTEIISFRKRTNKISNEDDDYLTEAITKRIMRKLEEYNLQPLSPQSDVGVEDVLNKHWKHSTIWDAGDGHSIVDCPRCCYEKNVIAAMQEYASLSLGEKDKIIDKYAISARAIAVWLKDFCNEDLPYDEMISDAARKASKELSTKTAEVEELKGVVVELINWAKPEAVGRWNFEAVIEKAELKLSKLNAVQGDGT